MRHTPTSTEVVVRIAPRIELSATVQRELTALARRGRVEARAQQGVKIVLLAAQGWQNKDIAAEVDLDRSQVALWRQRFLDGGVEALLHDAPRPGRTPSVTAGGELGHEGGEAVHRRAIGQCMARCLGQRRLGARGWRDGVARGLGKLVGVGEHHLAPGLAHVCHSTK
ncbi:helix-turn-helix domain-containing protein [Variovorax ginsengisoli]|uniref:helix-turn-helix domain-containing protein n=1 Tax=Variovorax ginsengisoli TaxID=363844 RepID=UPI0034568504